jgi:hypothetical protein
MPRQGGISYGRPQVALQIKSLQRTAEPVKLNFSMNTVAECITYCRRKVAERVVPYAGGHRALEIIIEGRGMTPARCIVLKPWRLTGR